ncbi:MAG: DUF1343 domain-containing protein [Saprospiraceae bacterium]
MKIKISLSIIIILTAFLNNYIDAQVHEIVSTGIEVLRDDNFDILKNKRVGLITNPTGVDSQLKSTIDILFEAKEVNLVALFGPEHGARGNSYAGDDINNFKDEKTGIPVFSLYGKTRKPTKEMLENIDVLVFDIQDIGCRSYTYISTMGYAMEAAAEYGIEFVVLDRPNPLGGLKIEGPIASDGYISFVSAYPIPYVYGLTIGELATYLNEEKILKSKCKLTVVPMKGWKRNMKYSDTGLKWVLTSPHIPSSNIAEYYVCTGIIGELQEFNTGIGYTLPFQLFGHENINADLLVEKLNNLKLSGITFRPIHYKPFYGNDSGKNIDGVQLYITDSDRINLMSIQFLLLQEFHNLYPDIDIIQNAESRFNMFDKVCGTDQIKLLFFENYNYNDIKQLIESDNINYKKAIRKYFLYN